MSDLSGEIMTQWLAATNFDISPYLDCSVQM